MRTAAALILMLAAGCGPGEGPPAAPSVPVPAGSPSAAERLRRAQDHLARERLADAAAEYRAVLAQEPRNVPALEGLSRVSARMDDAPAALVFITRAAEVSPSDASIINQLGVALLSNGRKREAAAAFERATALNPKDPLPLLNAAQNQADLGDWAKATKFAEAAAALIPDDATPWLLMGRFQMRQEKFAEAIPPLKEAARRAPEEAMVQYYLGKSLAAAGRRDEAREPLRAALRGNPPDDVRKEVEAILAGK